LVHSLNGPPQRIWLIEEQYHPKMLPEDGWYYMSTGVKLGMPNAGPEKGPISIDALQSLWRTESIVRGTLIWGPPLAD